MLKASRLNVLRQNLIKARHLSTQVQSKNENSEVSEHAEYPPIADTSYKAKKTREVLKWHEKIKKIGTIEEKLIEINIPRYYGYKCLMLDENVFPYNTLPFFKYVTKTEFEEFSPASESNEVDSFLNLIRSDIQDAFEFELDGYKKSFDIKSTDLKPIEIQRIKTSGIVKQLNRIIVNTLGADNRHLYETDVDVDPRHEAFWFVGGIEPTKRVREQRESLKWFKPYAEEPLNRPFQYIGKPFLAVRHQHPLKPFVNVDFDSITTENENIPSVSIDPRALGFSTDHRHGTSVPGFWPGNVREYGLISYQDRSFMNLRKKKPFGDVDNQEALHSCGIISSFSWLFAQACYQGFSTYNDMTYPLATQTIVTDGQMWSFYKYQMNTTCTHTQLDGPNFRYNQCWGTKEMKLYDQIDENGKIQGLNDDVLKILLQFYLNQPAPREHEMKPFLDKNERKIADIEDEKRRDWLEKRFKSLVSNRPRQRLTPEVYNWEKIYKIDNNTKPLSRRLRFFELGIDPFKRQLNEHQPAYIRRGLRARGPHDKKKWDATYYPLDHRMNIPKERSHSMMGAPRNPFVALMDRKRKSYK